MSRLNQHTVHVDRSRLRLWQKKCNSLVDAQEKAEEDILVAMCEMKAEGLSNAAIAGMFAISPSGVAEKVRRGEKILAARKGEGSKV